MIHPAHAPHSHIPIQSHPGKLYVVTCISNPARYRARYRLYKSFAKHMEDLGAILYTVEMAFGDREFEVTKEEHPRHIRVRGDNELWHKENLLNIGISRLPHDAEYVSIIDADFTFTRHDVVQETLHQLQHHPVVQMYSSVSGLDAKEEIMGNPTPSFMKAWRSGAILTGPNGNAQTKLLYVEGGKKKALDYPINLADIGTPGGAWAYRRDALHKLGGLLDFSLVGAADWFMACALLGLCPIILNKEKNHFTDAIYRWEQRALRHIQKNVGYVPGHVLHHWHGPMANRNYGTRWQILTRHNFNPLTDIYYDSQGLLILNDDGTERMQQMRDDLHAYFHIRNEDEM